MFFPRYQNFFNKELNNYKQRIIDKNNTVILNFI